MSSKPGMIRKSLDPEDLHHSPLDQNRIDEGYDNLDVKVLHYPSKAEFDRLVHKAVLSTRGCDIADESINETLVQEAHSGGLNQCLEWVTVVFEISGCSRGLTHELVRTRKASFAQQSFRHTNMGYAPNMRMPVAIAEDDDARRVWEDVIAICKEAYAVLVDLDIPFQDARTVLPIATETYIVAEYPLSEFISTFSYRACHMMYPEIVVLFRKMRDALLEVCPWLEPFIKITCEKTPPTTIHLHKCTFQGWEQVEGYCPFPWAVESNRTWKSSVFKA